MKFILALSILFLLSSCSRPDAKLKERIINADSVAINFFTGNGSSDSVTAVKIIRNNHQQLQQLATFVSAAGTSKIFNCGYDGSIHFFKRGQVIQDLDFRMNDAACMHFTYRLQGKTMFTKLSEEAKQLLLFISNN